MNRFADDPEVLAEQHARSRFAGVERDEGKSYAPAIARPSPLVAGWACRARCGRFVPVDSTALEQRERWNEQLRDRGEREISEDEIVFCSTCIDRAAPRRDGALRRDADEMAALIRELKTLIDNDLRERSVLARIRQLGHPDVDGLIRSVRASRAASKTPTTRRRDP